MNACWASFHATEPLQAFPLYDIFQLQATWRVGQTVKIRSVSAEDAENLQSSGPAGEFFSMGLVVVLAYIFCWGGGTLWAGWDSSMQRDLGQTKQIEQLGGGSCEVSGGWSWMLGLLEACDTHTVTGSGDSA